MSALLTMAKNKEGNLVHIHDVPNGLKCGCFCPHCKAPLVAKNGGDELKRDYHFAHANGNECENSFESALHMLAKEVIKDKQRICLPSTYGNDFPNGIVKLHNVVTEQRDPVFGFIPDAEGIMENGERLLIEFYVSHKVDSNKRKKILDNNLKCIELDINSLDLDRSVMESFICSEEDDRKWITAVPDVFYKHDGEGSGHSVNPTYQLIRERLKLLFDTRTLLIQPDKDSDDWYGNNPYRKLHYDLKNNLKYDTCIPGKKYRGLRTDLLLFRSAYREIDKKGYIAVCIRGRRRNFGFKYPKGLRVIDIIVSGMHSVNVEDLFMEGYINYPNSAITVEYVNFDVK